MRVNTRDHAHMDKMRLITLFVCEKEKEKKRKREHRSFIYICLYGAGRHLLGFIDRIISRPSMPFCVPAFSIRCNKCDMIEEM